MSGVQLLSALSDFGDLQVGSKGEEVKQLQQFLTDAGISPGEIDGIYGQNTAAAVSALQRKLGIDVDGIFGPKTKAAAEADLQSPQSMLRQGAKVIQLRPLPTPTATGATPAPSTAIIPAAGAAPPADAEAVPFYQQPWFVPALLVGGGAVLFWLLKGGKGAASMPATAPAVAGVDDLDALDAELEGLEAPPRRRGSGASRKGKKRAKK